MKTMTEPMSDDRLRELREKAWHDQMFPTQVVGELLAEVDRLRAAAETGWQYAHVYTEMDGSPRPHRVDEQTIRAHKPDGHRADGSPYWNYQQVKRRKAGPWVPLNEGP